MKNKFSQIFSKQIEDNINKKIIKFKKDLRIPIQRFIHTPTNNWI